MEITSSNSWEFFSKRNALDVWNKLKERPFFNKDIDIEQLFVSLVTYWFTPEREWVDYIIQQRIMYEYQMIYNPGIYSILHGNKRVPLQVRIEDKNIVSTRIKDLRDIKQKWWTRDIDNWLQIALRTWGDMNSYIITHAGKPPKKAR